MTNSRSEEFELVTWGRGGRFARCDIDRSSRLLKPTTWSGTRCEPNGREGSVMPKPLHRRLGL